MSTLGINDLKQFALPTGWDASELLKYELADGATYEAAINDILGGLIATTQDMLNDPFYGQLVRVTTELGREVRDGVATTGMSARTEYQKADPKRGKTIGWMFPLNSYDRTLGWTWDFLRRARQSQLDSDIETAVYDVRDNWERQILTRFFSTTENQLGTSGFDVPFVKGTGSVAYTPPAAMGQTFANTHTHFDRKTDDATGWADALEAGAAHLHEHGIMAPYIGIVPFADRANFTSLAGFIKPDRGVTYIQAVSTSALTVARMDETFFGMYETALGLVQLYASYRLPANYLGMFKGYGANNPRNPLAMRVDPQFGASPVLLSGEGHRHYPLENATIVHEFGIGVNDRLNGYACEFDSSGSYADPTIT